LSSTEASSYQWYLNSELVEGATNQTYAVSTFGDCFVVVTDSLGCQAVSNVISFTNSVLEQIVSSLKVYPNPTKGSFLLSVHSIESIDVSVGVVDIVGQPVMETGVSLVPGIQNIPLDISGYPSGMYILQLKTGKGNAVSRVVLL
jgi:hypothetical protein